MNLAFGNMTLEALPVVVLDGFSTSGVRLGIGEAAGVGVKAGAAVCPAVIGWRVAVLRIAQLSAKMNSAATAIQAAVRTKLLVI
jgi:hypothetical protein